MPCVASPAPLAPTFYPRTTTVLFCSSPQLHKIKAVYPEAKLILRLRTDDSKSVCQLSNKYGANIEDVPRLLDTARTLGLNVVGISYHVGSGCSDISSYAAALKTARTAFDMAATKGFAFTLLDIGGGFPGSGSDTSLKPGFATAGTPSANSFADIASVIRSGLATMFPATSGVRVIAEPGRFFVEGAFALCASVIARRSTVVPADSSASTAFLTGSMTDMDIDLARAVGARKFSTREVEHTRYYINDSVYGSFNCVMYDHASVKPTPLPTAVIGKPLPDFRRHLATAECAPDVFPVDVAGPVCDSSIWGQTCDGIDLVVKNVPMPPLAIGDWMCFENMGAYTLAAGGTFNGFTQPQVFYVDDDGEKEDETALTQDELLERFRRRANDPTAMLP
ncbi:MAG: hypothetical protein P4L96_19630 [Rhodoferax sp.]|nr:hypothetical protein [Rhodoferax sp.]